ADRTSKQRDRVGVHCLLGRDRAELEDCLQAVTNLGRVILGLSGMGRKSRSHQDHRGNHSKELTHNILLACGTCHTDTTSRIVDRSHVTVEHFCSGSKGEELSVSQSRPLRPTKLTSVRRVATSLMGQ